MIPQEVLDVSFAILLIICCGGYLGLVGLVLHGFFSRPDQVWKCPPI